MGKGTVRFVTTYAIQMLLPPKLVEKHLQFKVRYLTINLRRSFGEATYVGKAKTKFGARFDNYKSAHRSYRKKRKVSQQRFYEHYGQHSHNGIDDWQFTLIEQCETQ